MTERRWKDEERAEPWIIRPRQRCISEIMSQQRSPEEAVQSAPIIPAIMSCLIHTFEYSTLGVSLVVSVVPERTSAAALP